MGASEPIQPVPEDESAGGKADWLVGAEEGLEAEMQKRAGESVILQRPALLRPEMLSPDGATPAPAGDAGPARIGLPLPPAPPPPPTAAKRVGAVTPDLESESDFERGPAMTWEPGARSVPALKRDLPPAPPPAPLPTHDFPMDDAEERARERAAVLEGAMADALAASRPHEVVSPEAFQSEAVALPWWIRLVDTVRTDRRLQIVVLVAAVVLFALVAWPHGEQPTPVGRIRRHPERYDGASVFVAGKVGQVFHVGGGYAFYLLDRKDTLVVFTRVRVPVERHHVELHGTMSNGWLDGLPTLALFESATESK